MGFEELWNGFNVVAKKVEDGERFERDFARFVKKLHEIEETYSSSLLKLVKSLELNLEIGSVNEAWLAIRNEYEVIANVHSTLATKLDTEVQGPLIEQIKEGKKSRSATLSKGHQLCRDLVQAEAIMTKERKKYVKLRKLQDSCQEELNRAQQQNSSSIPKIQKKLEETIKKADKADTDYSNAVNNLKMMQDRFYDSEMPQVLKELENLEVQRMNKMRDLFNKLVRVNEPVSPERQTAIQKMKNKIDAINTSNDLRQFVSQYKPTSNPPPRVQYFPYDSTVSFDQFFYKPIRPSTKSGAAGGTSSSSISSTPTSSSSSKSSSSKSSNPLNLFKNIGKGKKDKDKDNKSRDKEKEKEKEKERDKEREKDKTTSEKNEKKVQFNESAPKKEVSVSAPFKVEANSDFRTSTATASSSSASSSASANVSVSVAATSSPSTATTYVPSVTSPTKDDKNKAQAKTELQQLRALYDYDAEEDNEISFKEGEILYLIEKDESGWWRGRNSKGQEGVFPSNFVEVVGQESKNIVIPKNGETFKCKVLYDYDAEDESELTIREGEILQIQSEEDGWYYGTNSQGKAGNFPSNYVEIIK
jgi:hypothetical protein